MNYLSDLWFDLRMAWTDFRRWRKLSREIQQEWDADVARLREKGL